MTLRTRVLGTLAITLLLALCGPVAGLAEIGRAHV